MTADNLPVPAGGRLPAVPTTPGEADLVISESTADRVRRAPAANTRRSYSYQREKFHDWCANQAPPRCPLPATTQTLTEYASHLADNNKAPRTIEQAMSAIRTEHKLSGYERPGLEGVELVLTTYQRDRAEEGKREHQAAAISISQLRKMVDAAPDGPTGIRDRALIVLGWAMMARRSELVALDLPDLAETDDGLQVLVRKSKTDQKGVGVVVPVPYGSNPSTCPVRLMRAWRAELANRGITNGPVFRAIDRHGRLAGEEKYAGRALSPRMTGDGVAKILRKAASAAGLDGNISPHGLRAGGATEAYRSGADALKIGRVGRWTDGSPVLYRYIRTAEMWKDHPMRGVGL